MARKYEMTDSEFVELYMFKQECIQMQEDQYDREYRDQMVWRDDLD